MPPGIVWKNTEWGRREDRRDGFEFVDWREPGAARLPKCINPGSYFYGPAMEFMQVGPIGICLVYLIH